MQDKSEQSLFSEEEKAQVNVQLAQAKKKPKGDKQKNNIL